MQVTVAYLDQLCPSQWDVPIKWTLDFYKIAQFLCWKQFPRKLEDKPVNIFFNANCCLCHTTEWEFCFLPSKDWKTTACPTITSGIHLIIRHQKVVLLALQKTASDIDYWTRPTINHWPQQMCRPTIQPPLSINKMPQTMQKPLNDFLCCMHSFLHSYSLL